VSRVTLCEENCALSQLGRLLFATTDTFVAELNTSADRNKNAGAPITVDKNARG
jgi:hypothetical protein